MGGEVCSGPGTWAGWRRAGSLEESLRAKSGGEDPEQVDKFDTTVDGGMGKHFSLLWNLLCRPVRLFT